MSDFAVCTVVAKSHISLARVLADSFRRFHPDIRFFSLLSDELDGYFDPQAEPFQLVQLTELAIPNLHRFRFHYNSQELTYAATPYLLRHLLDRGFSGVGFMKQESLVLADLKPIFEQLRHCSILLTPHLLEPLSGDRARLREATILLAGIYNVGFLGVRATATARRFLSWWEDRLYRHCRHDVRRGMHFEQRWLDLAPAYFDDVQMIRDPGFNVAHWNLPDRQVVIDDDVVTVDGHVCRFFRFSGFDPEHPQAVTRYTNRLSMQNVGPAAGVFTRYLKLLEAAGYHETKLWPYAYGQFDNRVPVSDRARLKYHELAENAERFGDPLKTSSPDSFYHWLQLQPDAF